MFTPGEVSEGHVDRNKMQRRWSYFDAERRHTEIKTTPKSRSGDGKQAVQKQTRCVLACA